MVDPLFPCVDVHSQKLKLRIQVEYEKVHLLPALSLTQVLHCMIDISTTMESATSDVTSAIPVEMTRFETARVRGIVAQLLQHGSPVQGIVQTSDSIADALEFDLNVLTEIALERRCIDRIVTMAPEQSTPPAHSAGKVPKLGRWSSRALQN